MFGALGWQELFILVAIGVPFLVLLAVADNTGSSKAYLLWGILGIPGMVIGLVVMLLRAPRRPA